MNNITVFLLMAAGLAIFVLLGIFEGASFIHALAHTTQAPFTQHPGQVQL